MKKIKFLAVALAAFTMFSCSNDEIENLGNNVPGEQAVLTIKLKGDGDNQAQSRVSGPATDDDKAPIKDYLIFLFRDGGALDCPVVAGELNQQLTTTIAATTAAKNVYVVANTGGLTQGPFKDVKTEADLLAVTGNLMDDTNNASTQKKDYLWLSGMKAVEFTGNQGTAAVVLRFVAAKIELIVKDKRTNKDNGTIQIQDDAVVLLFAGKEAKFFGDATENSKQKAFYTGDQDYPDYFNTDVTVSTALFNASPVFGENLNGDVNNHFYTFGNNGKVQQTILAIKSTKTVTDGGSSTIYYPIQFTTDDAGHTIEPGKSYTVTVTLNGDVEAGQGGGTTDPEAPVIKSDIVVTVTSAKWDAVPISKEFN